MRDLTVLTELASAASPHDRSTQAERSEVGVGLAFVAIFGSCFFGAWFNRYAPPAAGGEAILMALGDGYLPYRDYFLQAPPGVSILVQAITAVAGPHLIATLAFGALLRVAASCALYGLLLAVGRPSFAALGTVCALMVSSTDMSDTPFYYNHIGAAFVVIGTYLGLVGTRGTGAWRLVATAGCGALLTFAVAMKQTLVFGAAGAFVAVVVLGLPRPASGWTTWVVAMVAGAATMVGAVCFWLSAHGLMDSFIFVMTQAPQAKGGVGRSLLRPLLQLPTLFVEGLATGFALILIAATVTLLVRFREDARRSNPIVVLMALGAWGFTAMLMYGRFVTLFLTAVGWWGSVAIALIGLWQFRTASLDAAGRARIALGLLAFSIGYSFAVSWPLFENMAFPGLAVVVVALLEAAPPSSRRPWVTAGVALAVGAMVFAIYRKVEAPFGWGPWREPPLYSASGDFEHPVLVGMRLSRPTSELYALTRRISSSATLPNEPIFVYPNLPILYAIADRRPATFALAHWVDTCPEFLGQQDAERLRSRPPKLMIIRQDDFTFVENQERLYRGGERSSVRDVIDAVAELRPRYDRVAVFEDSATAPIEFLVRRD